MGKKGVLRGFLLVLGIAIVSSMAIAAEQEIYKGTVNSGSQFEAGGITFNVSAYGAPPTKALVKYFTSTMIIDLNDCEQAGGLKICFSKAEEGDIDLEKRKTIYKLELTVYQNVGDIEIARTISKDGIDLGDTATIGVTLSNKQDIELTSVHYEDKFPDAISLVSADTPCIKRGNAAIWDGNIGVGKKILCSYSIKIINPVDISQKAAVSYNNGVASVSKESDSIGFHIKNEYFDIKISPSKDPIEYNEEIDASINVTNIKGDTLEVDKLKITLPGNYALIRQDGDLQELGWSGTIGINKTRSFKLELRGEKSGKEDLAVDIDLKYNNVPLHFQQKQGLAVKKPELKAASGFKTFQFKSGEQVPFIFNLTNPAKFGFKNLKIDISSNIAGFEAASLERPGIDANQSVEIYKKTLEMPDVTTTFDGEVIINYKYDTYKGETLSGAYTEYIFVLPGDKKPDVPAEQPTIAEAPKEENLTKIAEQLIENKTIEVVNQVEDKPFPVLFIILGVLALLIIFGVVMYILRRK